MLNARLLNVFVIAFAIAIAGCASKPPAVEKENLSAEEVKQRRQQIDGMAQSALEKFIATNPEVRQEIESAAGYGVFDINVVNAVLYVGATGPGVIVDNHGGQRTYMRSIRAGTGPGVGYQELFQIFVFKNKTAMEQFRVGDAVGGDVSASVTVGTAGKQYSFNPYITVYQVSEKGFAVQANWGGTGYVLDPNLN
ncbi:MAG: hypothetical protein FIB06_05785 [Betaproteobacteria bacterium]|nr:hypothetical protein [Betaproteobacteria bacterium]